MKIMSANSTSLTGTSQRAITGIRSLPVRPWHSDRLKASPFIPFYEERIGPDAAFSVYSGHMSPGYLDDDVEAEYWHLRRAVTLFDVPEHAIEFVGRDAGRFLDHLMTRRVSAMKVGRCGYGLMCYDDGGILMDGVLIRLAEDRFRYVLADGEIFGWLRAHRHGFEVEIVDTADWVLQVQGPRALDVLASVCDGGAPEPFGYFAAAHVTMAGQPLLITRTGWTGEVGFEIYVPENHDHAALWHHLMNKGERHDIHFASMSCMNVRRIEAGILDNGSDIDSSMTPYEAGLGGFVDLSKDDFVGRDALLTADRRPRLVGLKTHDTIERGMDIAVNGTPMGRIAATAYSPYLGHWLGYACFGKSGDWIGLEIACGPDGVPGETVGLPFYDAEKLIPRGKQSVAV
jgi:glycine cleavage system aminomethyltransferase T